MNRLDKNAEFIHRTLQILCVFGFESKMIETQQQHNRCYKCHGYNIKYPHNVPRGSLISSGDNFIEFNCSGTIIWMATCNDCGTDLPISTQYCYNSKSGVVVIHRDSFLSDNGWYGHYRSSRENLVDIMRSKLNN